MIRKYINICIIFIFFFISYPVNANTFEKSLANPFLVKLPFNYTFILQSNIFLQNNNLRSLFSSFNNNEQKYNIVLSNSVDGMNWDNPTVNKTILSLNANLYAPRILTHSNITDLYFTLENQSLGIYRVECDSDFNCNSNPISLIQPTVNSWYSSHAGGAYPYLSNSTYYMFFEGNNGIWAVGMAYSSDNIHWNVCNSPIINDAGGSYLFKTDNKYYLYFHSNNGIESVETTNLDECNTVWTNRHIILSRDQWYDANHMIAPSLVEKDGQLRLYYTGLGTDNIWRLNMAIASPQLPSPTIPPSPSPTPTAILPSPSPTPITATKTPIILIPGFMSSWNKDAIVYNKNVSIYDWTKPSFVKEYDGIIKTLENLGYEKNKDYYLFTYDWRKPVKNTASDLKKYVKEKVSPKHPNAKVNIVGHSLGGLVGRIYTQENKDAVNKLLTVGSPHKGVVQVYSPLSAGDIPHDNNFLFLAEKIILLLNKSAVETDKTTMQNRFAVAFDLLPTFDFLKMDNTLVPHSQMSIKNITIPEYDTDINQIFSKITSIYGEKNTNTTPAVYIVDKRNKLDEMLDLYKDGKPQKTILENGDYLVLSKSGKTGVNPQKLSYDHSEVITEKNSIAKILTLLNIPFQNSNLFAGQKTNINPSLVFIMQSPAKMQLLDPKGNIFNEEEGILFVPNPTSGSYELRVKGLNNGIYNILIGKITNDNDFWTTIHGRIVASPPTSQEDIYPLSIDLANNNPIFNDPLTLFDELILYLKDINTNGIKTLDKAQENIKDAKKLFYLGQIERIEIELKNAHKNIFKSYNTHKAIDIDSLLEAINKLENLYISLPFQQRDISKDNFHNYNVRLRNAEQYLSHRADNTQYKALYLKLAVDKLEQSKLNSNPFLLLTVDELLKLVYSED